jgi:hypothetical protein
MKVPPIATVEMAISALARATEALNVARAAANEAETTETLERFNNAYIAEWRARDILWLARRYERRE